MCPANVLIISNLRLDLLPFHARLVRTLSPILPDIPTDLFTLLKKEFIYHVRTSSTFFLSKLRLNTNPQPNVAIACQKGLLENFAEHAATILFCNVILSNLSI